MLVNTKLIIENLGNNIFANLANICMIVFLYFWAINYSQLQIGNDLLEPMITIISLSIIQIIAKSISYKNLSIVEEFIYLGIIGTWVLVLTLVWYSNQIDLIIISNFIFISLILINVLLPKNFQLLNSIFFSIYIIFINVFFFFHLYFRVKTGWIFHGFFMRSLTYL